MANAAFPNSLPIDLPDDVTSAPRARSNHNSFPPPPDVEPLPEKAGDTGNGARPAPMPPRGPLDHVINVVHLLSKASGITAASMFFIAMLLICQLVFIRYILNSSTVWQTEAVIYLMIGGTLIGLPYVQLLRGHVNVDLLPMYLKQGPRKILAVATLLCGIAISGMFTFYGMELVIEAYQGGWKSPTIWAPELWKPYLMLPVGFGLLFLQFLADLMCLLTNRSKAFHIEDNPF
ncbi:TRAP transporter small permease [Thalassospira sp.]|uniref:TRAP transporter small permease n=1 Tax=Thalassospira sp. TaxID=1912094 RepID=UPI0032ECDA61